MNSEFGNIEQLTVMFSGLADGEAERISDDFGAREGVMYASFQPEEDEKTLNGVRYQKVNLFLTMEDPVGFIRELEKELDSKKYEYWMSGSAAQTLRTQRSISAEIPIAMAISVVVVVAVLFISSHSYI